MQRLALVFAFGLVACGPSLEAEPVKSPDELIAEQERLGDEQLKRQQEGSGAYDDTQGSTDEEEKRQWDETGADRAIRQAVRSAETCPESVTEKGPKAVTTVTMTFANDGNVKEASLGSPLGEDSALGKCVLRAMKAIIVPSYVGAEKTVSWDVDLTGNKKSGPTGGDKKGE